MRPLILRRAVAAVDRIGFYVTRQQSSNHGPGEQHAMHVGRTLLQRRLGENEWFTHKPRSNDNQSVVPSMIRRRCGPCCCCRRHLSSSQSHARTQRQRLRRWLVTVAAAAAVETSSEANWNLLIYFTRTRLAEARRRVAVRSARRDDCLCCVLVAQCLERAENAVLENQTLGGGGASRLSPIKRKFVIQLDGAAAVDAATSHNALCRRLRRGSVCANTEHARTERRARTHANRRCRVCSPKTFVQSRP